MVVSVKEWVGFCFLESQLSVYPYSVPGVTRDIWHTG